MAKISTGIKTIVLNGVAVGELQSTGDLEADASAIREFLKDKGLYKETTLVQAMFRQAVSFATTAAHLHKTDLLKSPRNVFSIVPFIVNSAFSIELYLKTLAQGHGKTLKGHELLKLYDALPLHAHEAIAKAISFCAKNRKFDEEPAFRQHLSELNDSFVEWRYCYEVEKTKSVYIEPTIFVMECLHEACRPLLNSQRRAQ
jgi:hypothetical protein